MQVLEEAVRRHRQGRLDDAERLYRRVLAHRPQQPDALHLLGVVRHQKGDHHEALPLLRRALGRAPTNAVYLNSLASVLLALDRPAEADTALTRALVLRPDYAEAWNNLGNARTRLGRWIEAVEAYDRALVARPDYPEALGNRGSALRLLSRLEDARASLERALAVRPGYTTALANLGLVLHDLGRFEDALATYDRALDREPDHAEAHANRAILLLRLGRFAEGWREYEWRWQVPGFTTAPRDFARPLWDGRPYPGRTLLVHAEQGLGSAIQFARLLPLAAERGGTLILECQPPLARLFRTSFADGGGPVRAVIERGSPLPSFDLHVPMMSLPHRLGVTLDNLPAAVPYLRAEAEQTRAWAARLTDRPPPRIGLVWAGNPGHANDHNRSLPPEILRPLVAAGGASFFSLQVGSGGTVDAFPNDGVVDLGTELDDFSTTAAVVATLDLIVSVDTAVAHLAGALDRPCWLLLPHPVEWRWLHGRDDSPWYPSFRLFRQRRHGDWADVIARVAASLRSLAPAG
jgi:tetratricopeptide (TPR) repeat protein